VFPNEGVFTWYAVQLLTMLQEMQADILPAIQRAYRDSEPLLGLAGDARRKTRAELLQEALEKWGGLWTKRLDRMSLDLARKFADKTGTVTDTQLAASFRKGGLTVKFRPTKASIEAYRAIAAEQVGLIKSIAQKYHSDVESKVWDSVRKGGDLHQLTEELKTTYGTAKKRAELIARDQNAKAKAVIEQTRRKELGIVKAIWMHSHAGKVPRETHVEMNGQTFDISKGMWDRDEQGYVLPGVLINCRCTSRAVIPGFD
jgi:SPP1 gp7 family putative phage head morphogenesis protein